MSYLVKAAEKRLAVSIAVATGAQPAHAAPCLAISRKGVRQVSFVVVRHGGLRKD